MKKGHRVIGYVVIFDSRYHTDQSLSYANFYADWESRHGSFQNYVTVSSHMLCVIPDSLPFTRAAVLPLSLSTAAHGLYSKSTLSLRLPPHAQDGKVLVVWGGSSSVGSSTIQLAVASGITVLTTASAKNEDYVRSLGAKWVVDYSSPTAVDEIVKTLEGKEVIGAFNVIGDAEITTSCAEILTRFGGGIVATSRPFFGELPKSVESKASECFHLSNNNLVLT